MFIEYMLGVATTSCLALAAWRYNLGQSWRRIGVELLEAALFIGAAWAVAHP